jgi:hypothetical protein
VGSRGEVCTHTLSLLLTHRLLWDVCIAVSPPPQGAGRGQRRWRNSCAKVTRFERRGASHRQFGGGCVAWRFSRRQRNGNLRWCPKRVALGILSVLHLSGACVCGALTRSAGGSGSGGASQGTARVVTSRPDQRRAGRMMDQCMLSQAAPRDMYSNSDYRDKV